MKLRARVFLGLIFTFAALLVFQLPTQAQQAFGSVPAKELLAQAAAVKNSGGGEVAILLDENTYQIDAQNRVTETLHRIYRIDTQDAVDDWASMSADWYPWYEDRPVIKARVVTPDGVQHDLDPKTLSEGPMGDDSPNVYEDGREYRAPFPAVTVGAVVEEEVLMKNHDPLFAAGVARSFSVGFSAGPTEKTLIVVRVAQSIPLKYVSRLLPNMSVEKKAEGGTVEYRFEQGRMEMLEQAEEALPSETPRHPYIFVSTGGSWQAIASAYDKVVEERARLSDVEAMVKQTVKPGDSREETIGKLLYLVHKKVRYTGVEFGDAALVPAYPSETLKRGYGDCKDKALLLTTMLRAAGIPAQMALLNAGTGHDTEPEMPGMYFNHAIVHVTGPPEMWLDATAESLRLGPTPEGDAGRLALIVEPGTRALVRTPDLKPGDNAQFEVREFVLSEDGPAVKVIETSRPTGVAEEWFRENYGSIDKKKSQETWEGYVKEAYIAEKLGEVTQTDASDLTKPFELRVVAEKCERGWTNDDKAEIAILPSALYGRLPDYLRAQDKSTKQDTKTEKPKKPRTSDYAFTPFLTEWEYRVAPPLGYKVRALPENKTESVGPAKLSYTFQIQADGSVVAKLRFDSVKGRYTAEETEEIRKAVRELERRDAIMITFDNTGHALLTDGKIAEALKQYEDVAAQHPKEALHRSQVAQAFLEAGLCETARKEARRATDLDPKSPKGYRELGWVLQHDLVCRRFKGDFDYNGAVAAYRKAIELDPSQVYTHVNLAILLEHGSDGVQYSAKSNLDDAIAEHKKIRQLDKEVAQRYAVNLLFDLMYGKHFDELKNELSSQAMDATKRAMMLAATANLSGAQAAIEESSRLARDEQTRSSALADAAHYLLKMRMYPEAAELMTVAAKGQENSAAALQQADVYRRTKRMDGSNYPDSDVRSLVYKSILYMTLGGRENDVLKLISRSSWEGQTREEVLELIRKEPNMAKARAQLAQAGLPVEAIMDIVLSGVQIAVEGDDTTGYHLVVQMSGSKNQSMFVTKEDGKYVMVGIKEAAPDLGPIVLDHLKNNNLEAARKVLDWARADIAIASGDDPLAGWAFPHLWTRGDPADPEKMRNAALSMVAARKDAKEWIPEIIKARDAAKSDSERVYLEDSLTNAYMIAQNWDGVRESALRQLKVYPRSNSTLGALAQSCGHLADWKTLSEVITARLNSIPDDPEPLRQQARLLELQSKFDEAGVILKKLIDSGAGTANDRNEYAWNSLLMHKVTQDSIEQARQSMATNKNYAIVHTLAALYAETGNSRQAQQLVIDLMNEDGMNEPDGGLWYVFGRVAESYQQPGTAVACYKRVEWKEKFSPNPMTTYTLAQQRLNGLNTSGVVEAK